MNNDLIIGTSAWIWQNFGKTLVRKAVGRAKNEWDNFKWAEAELAYIDRIKSKYGVIKLLGNPEPFSLEGIYTDVYILDKPTALRRFSIDELRKRAYEEDSLQPQSVRRNALQIVRQRNRLFILGKPGAGKTTFMKYIALQAANKKISKIPVFVSLKEWSESRLRLMSFIVKQFEICSFPSSRTFVETMLRKGSGLILFDGLDEVNEENKQRARIVRDIRTFAEQYHLNQFIITCRVSATDYTFEDFVDVEIADFDEDQIRIFAAKWFERSEQKHRLFLREFEKPEHRGIRELAHTPLLLALLCIAFDDNLRFPVQRAEIYKDALDALLRKWDSERAIRRDEIYRQLSSERKEKLFAKLAAEAFEKGDIFFRQEELARKIHSYVRRLPGVDKSDQISGISILKAIEAQHGIFVERAHRIHSFSHLTLQEFFTAQYIVDNASAGTFDRLIAHHASDRRWREVILLASSMCDNADGFFETFTREVDELIASDSRALQILRWGAGAGRANAFEAVKLNDARALLAAILLSFDLIHVLEKNRLHDSDLSHFRSRDDCLFLANALLRTIRRTSPSLKDQHIGRATVMVLNIVDGIAQALGQSQDLERLRGLNSSLSVGRFLRFDVADLLAKGLGSEKDSVPIEANLEYPNDFVQRIGRYLSGIELLLECLQSSYVSDRGKIVNGLFLAPKGPKLSGAFANERHYFDKSSRV